MSKEIILLPLNSVSPSCDFSHVVLAIKHCEDWDHFINYSNENGYPVEGFYPQGVTSYVATINKGEDDEQTGYGELPFFDVCGDELIFLFARELKKYFKENEKNFAKKQIGVITLPSNISIVYQIV